MSIIWFVGLAGYLWVSGTQSAAKFYGGQLSMWWMILNVDNESLQYIGKQEDRDKRQAANWTKYEKCQEEAKAFFYREAEGNQKAIPILLAVDFGTIVFAWLVAWVVVRTAAMGETWIRVSSLALATVRWLG